MATVTKLRPRAPRMDAEARRTHLVAAAIKAAGRRSVAAMTIDDVAREAGVSKAAVFKYFADRDALVSAVLDEVGRFTLERVERVRASTSDPVRFLVNLSIAYAASLETHLDYAKIALSPVTQDRAVGGRLGGIFLGFVALVEDTIREGIRQEKIPSDIDVELAAWTFAGYSATVAAAKHFGKPPEWIYHLQIALLRNLLGHEAVDRVLASGKPGALK
ncbi:MAG: TetR/AcrR family transcriptional regulator [Candidatus Binatia bacterium]